MDQTRFDELLERFRNDELSAAEGDQLAQALRANPQYRSEFFAMTLLDAGLSQHYFTATQRESATQTTQAAVFAGQAQRTWRGFAWGALAATVLLALALVCIPARQVEQTLTQVTSAEGDVLVHRGTEKVLRPAAGFELRDGDTISTESGGALTYRYTQENTVVELSAGSNLLVDSGRHGKQLKLNCGTLYAKVAPQPPGQILAVATPHGEATVRGTEFSLAVSADSTRLEVTEGKVALKSVDSDSQQDVVAGNFTLANRGSVAQPQSIPPVLMGFEAEAAELIPPMAVRQLQEKQPLLKSIWSNGIGLGTATFKLDIASSGEYVVWARVRAPDSKSDSFIVSVDNGEEDIFDVAEQKWAAKFQWAVVNGRGGNGPLKLTPRLFNLTRGKHRLVFRARDANCDLDKIIVTNDLKFVPEDDLGQPEEIGREPNF